jgi:surface protein
MFSACAKLESIDLSNFNTPKLTNISYMFQGCPLLKHLDVRSFDFTKVTTKTGAFASVPLDCEIIVADDTQKAWFTTNYVNLSNVKTVAEL